jgi:hypothetical protein
VDPDVAFTGQPYAFTDDDPLNLTDPLGNVYYGQGSSSQSALALFYEALIGEELNREAAASAQPAPASSWHPQPSTGQPSYCRTSGTISQSLNERCPGGVTYTGKGMAPTDSWSGNNPLKSAVGTAAGIFIPFGAEGLIGAAGTNTASMASSSLIFRGAITGAGALSALLGPAAEGPPTTIGSAVVQEIGEGTPTTADFLQNYYMYLSGQSTLSTQQSGDNP